LEFSSLSSSFSDGLIDRLIQEEVSKASPGTFLDFGPALPSEYSLDQLHLMVQSPYQIFAHWELTRALVTRTLGHYPAEDRPTFQILLKWYREAVAELLDIGTNTSWWFPTAPEERHHVELGLYAMEYGWIPLLSSAEVVTPRASLGPPVMGQAGEVRDDLWLLEDLVQQTGIVPEPQSDESILSIEEERTFGGRSFDKPVIQSSAEPPQVALFVSGGKRFATSEARPTSFSFPKP